MASAALATSRRRPSGERPGAVLVGRDAGRRVGWLPVFFVLGLIGLAFEYWYISLPIGIVLLVMFLWTFDRREQKRRLAHEAWLNAPPPAFVPPGRFTQNWIVANVPYLHPGQVETMFTEMRFPWME